MKSTTRLQKKFENDGISGVVDGVSNELWRRVSHNVLAPLLYRTSGVNILESADLREYALDQGRLWELDFEDPDVVSPERFSGNIDLGPDCPSDVENPEIERYTFDDPFVAQIPNGRIIGPAPITCTSDGSIVLDTLIQSQEDYYRFFRSLSHTIQERGPIYAYKILTNRNISAGNEHLQLNHGILLTSFWFNYGHWIAEHLLKLRHLERYEELTESRPTLILPLNPPRYALDALDVLGYEDRDWVEFDTDVVQVDRLVIPNYPHISPGNAQWLKMKFVEGNDEYVRPDFEYSKRVYVSRREASKKRILNEEEVVDVLDKYEFKTYVLENLHVVEQAKLFSQAEVVVGPSGSAFLNLMFSDDVTLLELVCRRPGCMWYRICEMFDFSHEFVFCEQSESDGWGDVFVDTDELRNRVEAIVK